MRSAASALVALLVVAPACGVFGRLTTGPTGRPCNPAKVPAEALGQSLLPVYRDCDVEQPAYMYPPEQGVTFQPTMAGCFSATVEFVVDEKGQPLPGWIRTVRSNDPDFARAVTRAVQHWTYAAAVRNGRAVPQVVIVAVQTGNQPGPSRRGGSGVSSRGSPNC
jgi:hypothetical protein